MSLIRWINLVFILLLGTALLGSSTLIPGDRQEQVRAFTRKIEFNYLSWGLNAMEVKINQFALGIPKYLTPEDQAQVVLDYLGLIRRIQQTENHLNQIYSDPDIANPEAVSALEREQLEEMHGQRDRLEPLAESILQRQIATILTEMDLSLGGQPVPPVLYHSTSLPLALVVSPREVIQLDEQVSLIPEMTVDQRATLEERVDKALNVSSLVVLVGGIGIYPTMVTQTSDLNFLTEVVAHEWTHNFLTLRPLGLSYLSSPELRTMNETAATIAGKEISRALMERYYPELLPPPPVETAETQNPQSQPPAPVFDFRAEMRLTRVTADKLLMEGRIEEAEAYMEERRTFLWEYGYQIRKLNQAYFAFYGAYADEPGGPAGEDPVGEAVRRFRAQSPSLAAFLNGIGWMYSFDQLQKAVE